MINAPNMHIYLPQVYPIEHPEHYKLHLACGYEEPTAPGGFLEPLDDFVEDRKQWDSWNWTPRKRNEFSRQYILAFMEFYPEKHQWLFGGAYEVSKHEWDGKKWNYGEAEPFEESKPFIGRLKIEFERPGRINAFCLENYYDQLIVSEILPQPYSGEVFCGYDQIDIGFTRLKQIIRRQRSDWRAALQYAKGVYLITDTRTGKRYVGSAYGRDGIWSRWECYVGTCHGYNDDLTRLIRKCGRDYAHRFFRFSLLEYFPMKVDDDVVTGRETYWKEVLLTRGKFGHNKN
jgi:hypothetical protein